MLAPKFTWDRDGLFRANQMNTSGQITKETNAKEEKEREAKYFNEVRPRRTRMYVLEKMWPSGEYFIEEKNTITQSLPYISRLQATDPSPTKLDRCFGA